MTLEEAGENPQLACESRNKSYWGHVTSVAEPIGKPWG